jgi:hypothetical protein
VPGFWPYGGVGADLQALRSHYFDSIGPIEPPWYVTRMPGGCTPPLPGTKLFNSSAQWVGPGASIASLIFA